MKQTWFTSDTHFNHTNVIKYSHRPWATIEEHNEGLIENWNNNVKQGDDIFHLGDFCYGNRTTGLAIRKRLNGNLHIIEGNHDSIAHQIRSTFIWFKQLHKIKVGEQEIVLCHYSMEVWNKSHHGAWHLYGHSHNSLVERTDRRSFDVGIDAVAARLSGITQGTRDRKVGDTKPQDFRPLNFDEVASIMGTKNWVSIDHHE